MKTYWEKFKLFWRELGNVFTNILCPLLSAIVAILEIFGLPISWINSVKQAEYWCWNACGTKNKIDSIIDVADKIVEELDNNDNNQG